DAISDLRDKKFVIYQFKTNHHLRLKNSNGIDINQSIKDKEQICKNKYSFIEILQKYNFEHYLYPTRYNDDQEVIRYFQVIFISDDIFLQVKNWNKKIENIDADGVIYNIVCKDKSNFEIIRKKLDGMLDFPRIIFVISEEKNSIEESVYIYQTAKSMLDDEIIQADPLMIQELNTVIEDNSNVLGRFITNYSVPEKRKSEYYHNGRRINICRKMQLSDLMSKICIEMYPNYPIVTNELINKTELSTSVINARDKIINALLSKKLEDRLGLEGYGPDVTIMRSTLVNTNIIKNIDNEPYISEHISEKWDYCFKVIEDFFLHSNKSSFSVLYKKLMKPSGGIGIKKGVIPIYIAVVIRKIREFTVFYHHDEEIDLSVNLLDRINISPNEYAVSLENWNAEKEQYIKAMERLFYKYMDEYEQNINPFSEIVLAVQRWYISLPKYTKEMKKHYQGNGNYLQNDLINVKFTNALKRNNINSREFLFDFLPNLFKKNNDYDAITKKVLIIKNEYDNELNNLFEKLKSDIMIHFQKIAHPDWSLSSVLREWYENLKKETKSHLFNHGENRVMTLIKNASNDEKSLIEQLAKHFTGLRVEDWNDNTIKIFNDSIKQFIETVTREDNTKQSNDRCEGNDKVFMGYYAENGQRVEHSFQRVNYSKRAELLKNEVEQAVEDMGSSISDNEKRQVIMDILEQLCR
ncbi:MAG: hypothetical protein PHN26_04480, partial [Eubacteriaceae bacterium]|nr:hypothetical protein [Eubacteriaceae bacterium]